MVLPNPRYSCPACPATKGRIEGSVAEHLDSHLAELGVHSVQAHRRAQGGQAHPLGAMSLNYIIQFDNS